MISQQSHSATYILSATDSVGATQQVTLQPEQSVFVGTSGNCGLRLSGNGLSEIHCRIAIADGELVIQDWMSEKGTFVNNEEITSEKKACAGDFITVGDYRIEVSTMEVTSQESVSSRKSTPEAEPSQDEQPRVGQFQSDGDILDDDESAAESLTALEADTERCALDIPDDFFSFEEEATYDHETVALLQAEIEDLQSALAQRDAEIGSPCPSASTASTSESDHGQSDKMLQRMQDLIDEANRSDERAALLEEMNLAAETANRAEREERSHLEGWVHDIEKRLSQREDEHAAEIQMLRRRLEESDKRQETLNRKLKEAAFRGGAPKQYEETLESLQSSNRKLQDELAESKRQNLSLEQKIDELSKQQERELREERVNLAKEQAKFSRMRFELSSKLTDVEALPKTQNPVETETANRIQALRAHLREIHEQEKLEEKEAPLTKRLAKLWRRVEY
jgi:pSer/pThr/pTyr-binding forkhead associated (FHA) protein